MDIIKETVANKEQHIERLKKEIEKTGKRLAEVERQSDILEIKKKSVDKQSEIQRKQLLEKIKNLEELVSSEKDSREMWINRYETE
jgi:chromosome segregation ATPase